MTPKHIRTELSNFLDLLMNSEIAIYANQVVERKRAGITRLTWPSSSDSDGEQFRQEFGTIQDYLGWINGAAYSAILYDGSLLQFSYDFLGNDLAGHRLCFYPCPFDVDQELLREAPFADVIEMYWADESSVVKLRSPVRFDYDPEAQQVGHPAMHLTVLWDHCRWAGFGPLSPGHFIHFVFQHFYPSLWTAQEFLRKWPTAQFDRTITPEEEASLHIAVSPAHFKNVPGSE